MQCQQWNGRRLQSPVRSAHPLRWYDGDGGFGSDGDVVGFVFGLVALD